MTKKKPNTTQFVKRIDSKGICGNVRKIAMELKDGESVDLYSVYGIANGTKTGESQFGAWTAFVGQFKANRGEKSFASSKAFLPDDVTDMLAAQLSASENSAVEFAFTITVKRDDESSVGYEYGFKPLIEPQENDPLLLLEQRVNAA